MENARSGRSKLGRLATSMRRKQLNKFSTSSTYTFRINLFRRCSRLLRGRRGLVMMVRIAPAYILRHEKLLDLSSSFSFEVPLPLRLTTKKVLYCTRTDTSNGQFFFPDQTKKRCLVFRFHRSCAELRWTRHNIWIQRPMGQTGFVWSMAHVGKESQFNEHRRNDSCFFFLHCCNSALTGSWLATEMNFKKGLSFELRRIVMQRG